MHGERLTRRTQSRERGNRRRLCDGLLGVTIDLNGSGASQALGHAGDDTLVGTAGDDWLIGLGGADTFQGGAGAEDAGGPHRRENLRPGVRHRARRTFLYRETTCRSTSENADKGGARDRTVRRKAFAERELRYLALGAEGSER
ncbi:MAG: hypothetical protein WC807_20335 [Hyphomicrobium sp.]